MEYTTVFDLSHAGFHAGDLLLTTLALVGVGIAMAVGKFGIFVSRSATRALGCALATFVLLIDLHVVSHQYDRYRTLRDKLSRGDFCVAQGIVTNFVPMPYQGHSRE